MNIYDIHSKDLWYALINIYDIHSIVHRDIRSKERYIYSKKLHVHSKEQSIHPKEPYIHSKEPYAHSQEPHIHSKEPYVHSKEPYIHSKEPCIHSKPLHTTQKRPTYNPKTQCNPLKEPVYLGRALCMLKGYIGTQKSPTYIQKRNGIGRHGHHVRDDPWTWHRLSCHAKKKSPSDNTTWKLWQYIK